MVVVGLLGVLSAVYLDDEASLVADKINDVAPDRLLTFELQAHEPVRTQVVPKTLLGFSLVRPQTFCLFEAIHWTLSPTPSPARGRGERRLLPTPFGRDRERGVKIAPHVPLPRPGEGSENYTACPLPAIGRRQQ